MEHAPHMPSGESAEKLKAGYDVRLQILFSRHAKKATHTGAITEEGEKDSQRFGTALKKMESMKGYDVAPTTHSGHKRTARTAYLIDHPEVDPRSLGEFKPESDEGKRNVLHSSVDRYSDAANEKYAELAKQDTVAQEGTPLSHFMELGDKRYDAQTPSSVEMSQMVAEDVLTMVDATKQMPGGSKKFMTHIVHSGVFEHFLVDVLKKRGQENMVEKMGGPLNFLGTDDFRVYVERKTPADVSIRFRFRDRNEEGKWLYVDLPEEELRRMAGPDEASE